ncbi:hypothetical protein PoB_000494700 [Plakobranchus ocellatus]|uniref:Uncharacterized protein n=1 Tax=Plakobranchus ocellatus TaxID=259542 RepID=A0AAV3Y8J4_9GAST|nr:hypothetical protein PoB_000494700 [Plakobranchus ocellatus]
MHSANMNKKYIKKWLNSQQKHWDKDNVMVYAYLLPLHRQFLKLASPLALRRIQSNGTICEVTVRINNSFFTSSSPLYLWSSSDLNIPPFLLLIRCSVSLAVWHSPVKWCST